jgi:hypothetical protein
MRWHVCLILVLVIAMCAQVLAQPDAEWSRYYGGDQQDVLRGFCVLEDSSLIMAGRCDSWGPGGADYWLMKTTEEGDSLWSRFFGGSAGDYPGGIEPCSDGGFVLFGSTASFGAGSSDIWLIKTDASGDSQWTRTFGGLNSDQTRSAVQTADGGFFIAGYTVNFGAGTEDFWLIRTNANGDSLWSRTFGGPSNERCFTSILGTSGNIYMAGDARSYGGGDKDVWLVAASPDGDSLWSRVFGGQFDEECRSIKLAADGGFFLVGGKNMDGADNWNVWVIRTDSLGNELWNRTYGADLNDFGGAAQILPDGGLIVGGHFEQYAGSVEDYWLLRLDSDGDSLWSTSYGNEYLDVLWVVKLAPDGGYYVGGRGTQADSVLGDWLVVKTGPDPCLDPQPVAPEITIRREGDSVVLSWNAVTVSTGGCVIDISSYGVYSGQDVDGSYSYLGSTSGTDYEHAGVVNFEDGLFYRVVAIADN